jgi:Phage integrase family
LSSNAGFWEKIAAYKVGEYPAVSLQIARLEGRRLLALMKAGKDPIWEKEKHQVATITVREVLDAYLACRQLRPNSIRSFVQLFHRCIADWLEMPIAEITRDMVVARHRELTRTTRQGTSGKTQANMAMERFGILVNFAANNFEVDGVPIVRSNPVKKLSQLRAWHPTTRRQTIIPDHKLAAWYEATMSVSRSVVSDYLLLLLFTGLRRNEAATLRWSDIDFDGKALTVRAEIAKNKHEHRFPLSHFLFALCRSEGRKHRIPFMCFLAGMEGTIWWTLVICLNKSRRDAATVSCCTIFVACF